MITKEQIDEFYSQSKIAMIGVSRNTKKFGYTAYSELKKKNIMSFLSILMRILSTTRFATAASKPCPQM
jgi:hypothetical protein